LEIRNSAERALKRWIQDIVNQPIRSETAQNSVGNVATLIAPPVERRSHKRVKGPAFERLPPVENFPAKPEPDYRPF
jgi:hypothetical protein